MKTAEVWLHYKQGDELSRHMDEHDDLIKGMRSYSDHLKDASQALEKIASIIAKDPENCEIDADTHMIAITGPDEIIDELINQELAELMDEEDFDDDEYFDDDDDDDEDFDEDEE